MGSTRKAGRPKVPAAGRILRAASEMFYREGIRAVGVDAIAAKANVTKKSLYDNFGSKDALIAAYLRARDERWRAWLVDEVDRRGGTAKERLLSTFDALEGWIEKGNFRGCGFVNAATELPHDGHPARAVVMDQKSWLRGYLEDLAAEGGAENPESLAEQLMILHEGANVASSLNISTNSAQRAREIASLLVADLG
ncbi:MAG: TetR/AcrR family transcriptional regulator [Rubrobacter sp.]|nr:TetR/AcrR family transcriptional regulator [Rubrobacter sp.]